MPSLTLNLNTIVRDFEKEYQAETGVELSGYRLTKLNNRLLIELLDLDENPTAQKVIDLKNHSVC
ncbi:hypothetical protein P4284_15985 [Bacillus swezeyi]|uniref:hypothetical protein n=1 Tax=Bacillus swezeyi TaxID=1925020 RepID=UPI002E23D5DF|nr:hypothetical protein [Bacillus swezeyi]